MKKLLIAYVLITAFPMCEAKVYNKKNRKSIQQDVDPVEKVAQQLAKFAALPVEEQRARTDEIGDYIANLFIKIRSNSDSEGDSDTGPDVGPGDANQVIKLIKRFQGK